MDVSSSFAVNFLGFFFHVLPEWGSSFPVAARLLPVFGTRCRIVAVEGKCGLERGLGETLSKEDI